MSTEVRPYKHMKRITAEGATQEAGGHGGAPLQNGDGDADCEVEWGDASACAAKLLGGEGMTREELARWVERGRCRVVGWRDAPTDGNRRVVAAVAEAFDNSESAVLVEPSLSRKTSRPPDVVLIDPEVGVAVIEVKG